MTYTCIQPPFSALQDLPKAELVRYYNWFLSIIPQRLDVLRTAVSDTTGFENTSLNMSPESLASLGSWFSGEVKTRPRTPDEMARISSSLSFPIDIPSTELTDRTFSIAYDVGIYFGEVLIQNNKGLRWEHDLKSKKLASYGQPVIQDLKGGPLDPIHITRTLAYGISKGTQGRQRLTELYDYWAARAL